MPSKSQRETFWVLKLTTTILKLVNAIENRYRKRVTDLIKDSIPKVKLEIKIR